MKLNHLSLTILVACCASPQPVLQSYAASSYDGTWTGQATGTGSCSGTIGTFKVANGVAMGALSGAANVRYQRAEIGSDGKVSLTGVRGTNSANVVFAGERFELRGYVQCGDLLTSR